MATRTIDIILNLDPKKTSDGAQKAVKSLKQVEEQANRTREKMEKLANVGTKLALVGGAILAPLGLAMKKYLDTVKDGEVTSKRILKLNQDWEQTQVRLGRIVATEVLPLLEKGAATLEKIITFAEQNPGVVKAALTIGVTLVTLGGIVATTAQIVSTIATIQGLAAGIGLGGGAAGGAAAGGTALSASIAAGFTAAIPALVSAIALYIGGNVGLWIGNALGGTNQTWKDIGETLKRILFITQFAWTKVIPQYFTYLGKLIGDTLRSLWASISAWFRGGKASGGYVGGGFYAVGEQGREFILNADTTRNAERAIGGGLTQQNALGLVTNNFQVGGGMTISQTRKMIRQNEAGITKSLAGAFS